ncbi:MAG: glycosyltransferase family 39 protein [Thermoleophilaceae bacterium]
MDGHLTRFGVRLALVAVAALAIRVVYLLTVGEDVVGIGDFYFYHWSANLIAEGRGFTDPFVLTSFGTELPTAEHPPLWSLFLSLVSLLGGSGSPVGVTGPEGDYLAHRLAGCLVGAGVVGLIGLLGRRLGGERLGLAAAGIAAVYPVLVTADASLMSESLYGLFVVLALLLAYRLIDRPDPWRASALGAVIGLAALTRGEGLLLLPLLALPLAWRGGRAGRGLRIAAVCLGMLVVVAPWTVRNHLALARFVPISTNEGGVIGGANCHRTYYGEDLGYWRTDCLPKQDEPIGKAEYAEQGRRQGIEYARENLGRLLTVVVPVRILRTWDLWQTERQVLLVEGRDPETWRAGLIAYFALLPLAGGGLLLLRRRGVSMWPLASLLVVVTVSSIGGFGNPRFRHAAEIALVTSGAVGLRYCWQRAREIARIPAVRDALE